MHKFEISGTGKCLPKKVLTNDYFEKSLKLDTSDAWIREKTGIKSRRIASEKEACSDLATRAGIMALEDAGISAKSLDMVIVATVTPDMLTPSTASIVQNNLGATSAVGFDINNACAGFLYAIDIAIRFLDKYSNILVIGSDLGSRIVDYTDRSNCFFFADGAGAIVISATTKNKGLLGSVAKSKVNPNIVKIPGGGSRNRFPKSKIDCFVKMNGREVWNYTIEEFPRLLRSALQSANIHEDDVSLLIPHQANLRMIESAASSLNFPMDKVFTNLQHYGNTMSASVPIALDEAKKSGRIDAGNKVALIAFGAGMVSSSMILQM